MSTYKYFVITVLCLLLVNCASEKPQLSVKTSAKNNRARLDETVKLSLNNPDGASIDKVTYKLQGKEVSASLKLDGKLGKQDLVAEVISNGETIIAQSNLIVVDNKKPVEYVYEIINTYPHDATSYTQGLEFYNGELYESTGQFGESKLRKLNYETGESLKDLNLNSGYFGEGLTVMNDRIYQLTWKADTGIIYDVNTFEKQGIFRYGKSKEGWGLCNDGKNLYKSDGTEKIWILNSETYAEEDKIEVYTQKREIGQLNELEWVDGKIYANLYQTNFIIMVNPKTGSIDGIMDLKELTKQIPNYSKEDNVLNGIAYNPDSETFFVTGKRWDKMFELKIIKK